MESRDILPHKARRPAYRRIAEGLRHEILTGKLSPGTLLPSTPELAAIWQSSTYTVHSALVTLVKEGWVERGNGMGTYVAHVENRFINAGIYHGVDICSNETPSFNRSIHSAVMQQLELLGKKAQTFVDSRPPLEQNTVLPALAEAILQRRIQCLIGVTLNEINSPALTPLPLPVAFLGSPESPNRVNFDQECLFGEGMQRLADQGCRFVGCITNLTRNFFAKTSKNKLVPSLSKAARLKGLKTRNEWMRHPAESVFKLPQYGYEQFHQLWRLPEKPEGLLVYPDVVALGVITAILEIGVHAVTKRMKFVFHRNAHIDFLCPFPVTWAVSNEDRMAQGMLEMIQKQFDGEKVSPLLIPYEFKEEQGSKASAEAKPSQRKRQAGSGPPQRNQK